MSEQTEKAYKHGYCLHCGKVQPLGQPEEGEYRCLGFGCGKPWYPQANPVPQGYEWLCPGCGTENAIPGLRELVVCANCGGEWQVDFGMVEHVFD